jgi:hypothetical protein
MILGAYYFNYAYIAITQPAYVSAMIANFGYILFLLLIPLFMIFFFTGYLRPSRGKAKRAALGPSLVLGLFFVILSYLMSTNTDMLGNVVYFSAWGIAGPLLVAGGFSVLQSLDEATTPGILDVSELHYGPVVEEPEAEESESKDSSNGAAAEGAEPDTTQ